MFVSSRFIQVDPSKPLLVPAGSDSLGSIGKMLFSCMSLLLLSLTNHFVSLLCKGAPLLPSGDISHISAKSVQVHLHTTALYLCFCRCLEIRMNCGSSHTQDFFLKR